MLISVFFKNYLGIFLGVCNFFCSHLPSLFIFAPDGDEKKAAQMKAQLMRSSWNLRFKLAGSSLIHSFVRTSLGPAGS